MLWRFLKIRETSKVWTMNKCHGDTGVMKTELVHTLTATFEAHAQQTENGVEYWLARDLQYLLGYAKWDNFLNVVFKAKTACEVSGHKASDHFADVGKMVRGFVAGYFAGSFCLEDNVQKIIPFRIAEQILKIARQPIFHAIFCLLGVRFKSGGERVHKFGFHDSSISMTFVHRPDFRRLANFKKSPEHLREAFLNYPDKVLFKSSEMFLAILSSNSRASLFKFSSSSFNSSSFS